MASSVKEVLKPVYEASERRRMRIVVLFSGGASAVPFMVGGEGFEVVGAISTSASATGVKVLEGLGIPVEIVDIRAFYGPRPISDMNVRESYDEKLVSVIEARNWNPDIVACSGYMYILTRKFLRRFRVLNVHPADLTIKVDGRRKYTGIHAVEDQMKAGETLTRSTVHLMDEVPDHGPVLVVSRGLPVANRGPKEQQELMKERCDGPAYRQALAMLSMGAFALDDENNTYVKEGGKWVRKIVRMDEGTG